MNTNTDTRRIYPQCCTSAFYEVPANLRAMSHTTLPADDCGWRIAHTPRQSLSKRPQHLHGVPTLEMICDASQATGEGNTPLSRPSWPHFTISAILWFAMVTAIMILITK